MKRPYYDIEAFQCIDENGNYYTVNKKKCENYFRNIRKSKTDAFDNNYLSQNRTIFITNFYSYIDYGFEFEQIREFSMCIEYDAPVTKGKGYACVVAENTDMVYPLENFNIKLAGYFFISSVGFNNEFFFSFKKCSENID